MRPTLPDRAAFLLLSLALLLALPGCTKPETYRTDAEAAIAVGDPDRAEELLRKGLEQHPEDVDLLVAAGEFYLRPIPEDRYKPRLALHYAMRADRAADNTNQMAAALLVRAWRANGGSEMGDQLVAEGLHEVGHRDQRTPVRLDAADPDLLEPTAQNLREQKRREAMRDKNPCGAGLAFVAGAAWPLPDGESADLPAFCAERDTRPGTCSARALRACTPDEVAVLCGPMVAVVGRHASCADATVGRCCASPLVSNGIE